MELFEKVDGLEDLGEGGVYLRFLAVEKRDDSLPLAIRWESHAIVSQPDSGEVINSIRIASLGSMRRAFPRRTSEKGVANATSRGPASSSRAARFATTGRETRAVAAHALCLFPLPGPRRR